MSSVQTGAPRKASELERRRRFLAEMDAVIDDHGAIYDTHPIAVTILMTEFFMEYLREVNKAFAGDMTLCIVLGEIGQSNMRRFVHASHLDRVPTRTADTSDLDAITKGCNGLSVSMASGIPRETVRRKISTLIDLGLITAHPAGGWVATAEAARRFSPMFNRDLSLRLLRTAKKILEL